MNIAMLIDIPASIAPDQEVLTDGSESLTYSELRERVARVAGMLAGLGVGVGDRVGVFATNNLAYAEIVYAAASRGAILVPMNFRAREDEARHLLDDSGAKVVFADRRYSELLESVRSPKNQRIVYIDGEYPQERDAAEPDFDISFEVEDEDVAVLMYTSGTTSLPKGVQLTHGGLTAYVMGNGEAADGTPRGSTLVSAPMYHVAGLGSLLVALFSGRRVVTMPQFKAEDWMDLVERYEIQHSFLVPTMLAMVLDSPHFDPTRLTSLETVAYGAAPMPPSVIRRAIDAFPKTVGFSGAYGQTETTSTVAILGPDDHRLEGTEAEIEKKLGRLHSIGRPLDDVELRVVGPEGDVLAPNAIGEMQIRTGRKMSGYLGKEEKTRVTIDNEGWVHTGDLGYIDEGGYAFLVGRSTDMIIRGGENIAPDEVERVLFAHPDIVDAACVGLPDEEWGERVEAAVVLRDGAGTTEADIIDFLRPRLSAFKRPERIHFMAELPRTSTGKLLRRNLRPQLLGEAVES